MSFMTNTSSNAKNEDLKKELQTIHGILLHVDPLKWFRESASGKQEEFAPFCILASCHLARADSGAFHEFVFSRAGVNMSTRQKTCFRSVKPRRSPCITTKMSWRNVSTKLVIKIVIKIELFNKLV
jgi:hypothetical protein